MAEDLDFREGTDEEAPEEGAADFGQPGEEAGAEEPQELSEEELDEVADTAIDVLREILAHFDAEGAEINEYEGDEGEILLDVVGGNLAVLIGRRGHTLESLQTLVSTITHKRLGNRYPVVVDVESYKHRQRQKIESMAYSAANRADRQDREVSLRPMNPYERRLVHMALRDDERVETYSVGTDPNRYVVIRPI